MIIILSVFEKLCLASEVCSTSKLPTNKLRYLNLYLWYQKTSERRRNECVKVCEYSCLKAILHDFLTSQICLNAIADISQQLYCWKYTVKWLKVTLFRPNNKFWPFLKNVTSGCTKRYVDWNSASIFSSCSTIHRVMLYNKILIVMDLINIESEPMISTQKFWHTSNFRSILWPSSGDWQPRSEVKDLAYI